MASTRAPILTLEHVHKSFGAVPVLHGVSFEVQRGQVTCIIGPSGSGKSTILRCINGLVEFDGGKIFVDGLNVAAGSIDKKALRRKVGMLFQQYNLFPHMTVLENVVMAPVAVLKETRG